jgi:predicted nucleic acid-binding Zn ribbon protein
MMTSASVLPPDSSPCPMCGKAVGPEATTCPHCGEACTPAVTLSPQEREQRRQKRLQKSLAGLGLLIAALAAIAMLSPPLAVGAALLLGPASVATMIKATAMYPPGKDPTGTQLNLFFWRFLGWTGLVEIGVPAALVVMLWIVCAVQGGL